VQWKSHDAAPERNPPARRAGGLAAALRVVVRVAGLEHFRPVAPPGAARPAMLEQYFPILLFIVVGLAIGGVLLGLGRLVAPDRPDPDKLSPYECGFEAFEDARMKFDVRYYLVAILFILFDLEIAFLFPWAVVLPEIGLFGFASMMIFLAILIVGFLYEWKKGALEWE
jgi:NADH-quinone oxidoreductase subunit A